jgi:hypothetical protein
LGGSSLGFSGAEGDIVDVAPNFGILLNENVGATNGAARGSAFMGKTGEVGLAVVGALIDDGGSGKDPLASFLSLAGEVGLGIGSETLALGGVGGATAGFAGTSLGSSYCLVLVAGLLKCESILTSSEKAMGLVI